MSGTREVARGPEGRLGGKVYQNHRVFLFKVDSPTVSRRRERSDPHRLPRWCTKVGRGTPAADQADQSPALYHNRQNPYSWKLFGELAPLVRLDIALDHF